MAARLWTVPEPLSTAAEGAALETNVMTGMELGEDDLVRLLDIINLAIALGMHEAAQGWRPALRALAPGSVATGHSHCAVWRFAAVEHSEGCTSVMVQIF